MEKKIELSTLNISVNVLMLDNKRFTKSVFNQLPFCKLFTDKLNTKEEIDSFFKVNQIIGYVDNIYKPRFGLHTQRCYLVIKDRKLYISDHYDYTELIDHLNKAKTCDFELHENLRQYLMSKIKDIGQIFISC